MRRRRPKKRSNALVCEELEPRLLLSADLVGIAVDLAPNDAEPEVEKADVQAIEAALQVGSPSQVGEHDSPTVELVIIDPATPDYQSLVDDLISQNGNGRSFEIVLLDTAGNGIEQISDILSAYQDLDAVHILSHGSDGGIQLGDAYLNLDSLSANAGAIESWRDAFSEEGDLLIYGCDLAAGEDGRSLVEALARLTGADVAASDDITGHETLGGDWDLEHAEGVIETEVAVSEEGQRNWSGILATDIDFTHTDDPVHHWTLDGDALDSVGSADGTVTGATTVTGQDGDALRFDEVDDYVTIPDVTMNNDFTVTFQFKVDDNTGSLFQYLYSHGDVNTENSLNIYINESSQGTAPNALRTVIRDTDDTLDYFALDFDISSIVGDGEWHTYTLTVQSGVGSTVYLDGVQKNTDTRGGDSINPSGNVYLGAPQDLDPDRMFGGDLDDVKIYDHVHPPTGVGTGLSAGTVIATDPVGGTVTYSLVDDAGGMFSIDSDSGELFWAGAPDTSTAQSYDITVRATDSGAPTYDEVMTIKTGTVDWDTITGTSHDDLIYGLGEGGSSLGTTNYITNGSFESGGSPSSAGWTLLSGPGFQIKTSGENGVLSSDGAYYLDTDESPGNISFEQTVTGLTDGQQYRLSFEAADFGFGFDNSLSIYFGGQLIGAIDPETSAMSTYSYSVTAGSGDGSDELRFVETGAEDAGGTAIDNIRMYAVIDGGDTLTGGAGDDILIGDGIGGSGTTSQPITINDAGFENTALPDGGTGPLSAAWTDDFGYNEVFIGDPSTFVFSSGAPAEGENALFMVEDNRVSQTLASNFDSSKDYELSLQLGNSLSSGNGNTYSVELYAGGTLIGSATGTEPAADTWTGINISVDGDAYAAADGTALRIVLENTSSYFFGDYFAVDDIQLNEITSVVAAGDDTLTGGAGDDYLDGGAGTDTAVFSGARADYTIDYYAATGELVVSDTRGGSPDGADTLINIETLQFSDQAVLITDPSAQFNDAPVGSPVITGIVTEDQTLTADTSGISDADGLGAFSFQWLRDGVDISGATASTYTLGDADVGTQISVEVSYTDGQGTNEGPLTSAQTAAVVNANDTPVANADSISVAEGGTATTLDGGFTTVLNNDTGLGDTPVTVSLVTDVTNGTLTLNGDGTFSYTHDGSENFTDSFTYRITDNDGETADAIVTINVTPVSDETPVANADSISVAEGGTATLLDGGFATVLNNDTGLGDTPVTVSLVTDVTNGSLTLNGDGTFSYTHDGSENFTDSFTYRITDNDGDTADAAVTINVTPVSDATPVANADSVSVVEGGTASTLDGGFSTVLNNDTGLGDTPVTVSLVTDVTNGTLILNGDGTFSYTHDGSENFTDSFTYRITDNDGETADATVTINITPVSDATPVANADSISVAEGGTATTLNGGFTTVLNNDTGLGDTPVTVSLITDVTNGTLTLNSDGTFSYTHDGSENFTDSFTYRVTDNDGETADATVMINVTPVSDQTPVANADSVSVAEGGTATTLDGGFSTVLNNDTGLGDTPVTVSLVQDVTNGTLTLNGDGTFSYTHDGSENFTDSFTYRITDNDGETADAIVTINVTPVSDETPVANADSISVVEGGTASTLDGGFSTVLNNDTGLGDTPVTVSLVTDVTYGTLTLNGDGTFSYTHDGSENFTDSFTYRITDNDGETADAIVTINVTPVSDETPVANTDSISVAEGGTATLLDGGFSTVLNNDTGLGDTPVTVSLVTDVTNGTLTLNSDGTFSYTHDGSENFTDSFTYRITDNDGETADAAVTINVTPVSDATPVANADSISVAEGGTATTLDGGFSTVLNNDTGLGDTPVTVSLVTDVTNGSLTLNSDGTFSYTHDGSENLTDSFTYRITDNDGETADATVTINITPVSDTTPVANADSISVAEGGTATTLNGGYTSVLNNDTGLGDTPVTVSLVTDVTYGTLTLNGDGTFSYTHDGSENLTDSFTYRVTDNDSETADATVTINVTPVSDETPVANADSISVAEGGTATTLDGGFSTVLNNDTGLGDTPVTVSLVTDVTNGTLTLNGDGTFSYTHDGSENFTDSFTYRITDNDGETADATVTINITPVSDATPVANADSISVAEGGTATTLNGGFTSVLNNDTGLGDTPVTVSLVTDVTNGTLTLNGDGTFSYTHDGSENFTDSFTYRITDNDGETADAIVTINVTPVSDETPVANADSISVAEGGTATTLDGGFSTVLNNDTGLGDTPVTVSLVTDVTNGTLTLNGDGTFSYTHDGSENFTDSFTYRITDNDGETADATVTINVTPVSDETPVANADTVIVVEGGTTTLLDGGFTTVLNNDTGLGDTPVTVSLVTDVTNGSLTLNGDGTFSYTHDGSENFTDSFTYRITDNDGDTADAAVTINVTPVSDATPVANADSVSVVEGGTASTLDGGFSTVLNNDTGLGDTPVTVSLVTDVTNGTLILNGDGTFSYTHDGSENFTDSFTYRITDNDGETADATVTINITPVSDATPVANADSISVAEGGTATTLNGGFTTVLNNDTGLGDTPVTVSLVTDVTNGSLTLNSDGTFSYTHDGSENFTDSFTYRVTDNDGEAADATVTINITPVSDATPVANADSISVAEGGTATTLNGGFTTVLNNDTGLGDTPVTVSLVTDVTNGSLTLNGDGTFSYTHDGSENLTDSFTYRVTDNDGEMADATVTINVTPVSDETPVANADSISVAEGGTAITLVGGSSTILNNDTGLGDTPVTVSLVQDVMNGTLTLNGDGTFSYTHDGSENFTDSFTYRVTDNDGETADATVTINITPVSDATPVANADSISVAEGGIATTLDGGFATVLNNDTGLGDTPVTVSLVTDVTNGTLTLNGDGTFSYTHDGSENLSDSFTYRVTDNDGETADATVTINVTPVSDETPVANADTVIVAEGGTATLLDGGFATVLNNDTGLGDTPVTVSLVTDVTYGTLTLNGDGTFSYTHDGSENFTDSFTYRITDNDGETADAAVTINVTPVSDAAPVANADSISVAEGGTATLLDGGFSTVLNNDTGLGDTPVTVSLVTDVTNGSLTLNGDGTFSYTHDGSENLTDSFTYRVTDNDGEMADATVTINVTPVSDETPVANADSISVAEGGTAITLVGGSSTVLNNDTGLGDTPATVSLVTDVTNGTLTLNSDGTFSYTHDGSENFTDSFTYRITDNDGETADATVTINVTPVSDETPVANTDSITVAEGGTTTTLDGGFSTVLNNDTGLGDTPVTVSLVTDVMNGTLTLNSDGTFSYTHDGSENFTDSFTYRITDNDGETADATVAIDVVATNNDPVSSDVVISVLEDTVHTGNLPVANDDDGDTVIYQLETDPVHGVVTVEADGEFSYTPDADYHGADSFIYSVSDGNGGNNSYLVEIDVISVNDSPVITSHGENENVLLSLEENTTLVAMVTADDPENDALTFAIDGGADLGLFSIDPMSGELVFTQAPDMENPLDAGQDNLYQVQVLVSDGNGGTDRQTFTIEVTDVDEFDVGLLMDVEDTPDAISLSDSLNDGVGITVWAEDPDSSHNRITYSLDDDSNGLFAIDPASGTITLASTVESREASQFEITVRATSEDGSYSLHTFRVALNRVVEPPSEPEQPYLDDIIFDLDPEEPVESQATTDKAGPSQQPSPDVDAVSEEPSGEEQEASLSFETEEPTQGVIDDIERPAIERLSPSLFSGDGRNSYRYDYHQARLTPVPVAPDELPAFDTGIGELIEVPEEIWHLLDSMNSEMSEHQGQQTSTDRIVVQSATFSTLTLSAGYVAWLLRAGVLSASLLSFTPLWRQIDPLPVLSAHAKRRDEDQDHTPEEDPEEKRLAKLFDRKKKPEKNRSVFFRKDS